MTAAASAVARGEAAFRAARRRKRSAALLGAAVLLGCFLLSAWIAEADPATLRAGLPRIGETTLTAPSSMTTDRPRPE